MCDQRTILVRYNEIALKGRNRKFFEKTLLKNIKRSLPKDKGIKYRVPRGRIMIDLPTAVADEYAVFLSGEQSPLIKRLFDSVPPLVNIRLCDEGIPKVAVMTSVASSILFLASSPMP